MTDSALRIESFAPGDALFVEFEALRLRAQPGAALEPVHGAVACLIARHESDALARCTVQVVEDLHGASGRSGLVGHYESLDPIAGAALLRHACGLLAARGVVRVLGPMNGSTWARYRLALPTEPDDPTFDPPTFPGEPVNPFDYHEHFTAAGFTVAARYESRMDLAPGATDASHSITQDPVAPHGITVRSFNLGRFEDEIRAIFTLSLESFADNPYYAPIGWSEFRATYEAIRPILDPELVLLAHDTSQRPVGFLFAYADPGSRVPGRMLRFVDKTIAVAPAARGMGLGNHLLDVLRVRARARGAGAVLHALMHVTNFSMKMSARHDTRLFRRYALYQWTP
jgi:ribosomal protein S18 acetylase RimI-like enzyme